MRNGYTDTNSLSLFSSEMYVKSGMNMERLILLLEGFLARVSALPAVIMYDDLSRGMKENTSGNAPTLRAQCHGNLPTVSIQRCFSKQYSIKTEETGTLQASRIDKVPNISDGTIIRRLTPIECERLQDYPDDWTEYGINKEGEQIEISDTQRYKTLGNSITVKVAEKIFKSINKAAR